MLLFFSSNFILLFSLSNLFLRLDGSSQSSGFLLLFFEVDLGVISGGGEGEEEVDDRGWMCEGKYNQRSNPGFLRPGEMGGLALED